MKFEANGSAENIVFFLCVLGVLIIAQSCWKLGNQHDFELDKMHIAAGECKDNWGKWDKCRQ